MTGAMIVTGGGGVGKTTVSAALAVAAARAGRRTLVMTVDPARRLADALGVEALGNDPAATGSQDGLWAAMLDATQSWEAIVRETADPATAQRLLASPYFRAVADRFPAGQSYAAGAQMGRHLESGDWDLLVVDTPPAAGGIDFFLAPSQIRGLVGGRLLRWGTGGRLPGRRRLFSLTARPMLRLADNVLGGPLLEEVAEFLMDLRSIYDGLTAGAKRVERHLRAARTLVVTTADPTPLQEAARFFREVSEVAGRPEAVVFNRALPLAWADPPAAPGGAGPEVVANLARWGAEAQRQRDASEDFAARFSVEPVAVPLLAEPPTDVAALAAMAAAPELAALVG